MTPILKKYGIKKASVFGSVARGDDKANSDVDVLIRLGDQPMGMFKYMQFIGEIEEKLGRKVDIVTEGADKFLRPYIVRELKTIYEK